MFSDHTAQGILQHITGEAAIFVEPTAYLALFTTAPTSDSGAGAVEPVGNGYARVQTSAATWNAAAGSGPSTISNAGAITFPTATGSWGTVVAFGLYDAAAAGNLLAWDWLGNVAWLPCTISSAAPGVITAHAHGYSAADNVVFSTVFGGTAPSFSQSNLTGLLAVVSPAADTFTVTNGGTAVNTSSTGNGMVRKVATQQIISGVQASFAAGALVLAAA